MIRKTLPIIIFPIGITAESNHNSPLIHCTLKYSNQKNFASFSFINPSDQVVASIIWIASPFSFFRFSLATLRNQIEFMSIGYYSLDLWPDLLFVYTATPIHSLFT